MKLIWCGAAGGGVVSIPPMAYAVAEATRVKKVKRVTPFKRQRFDAVSEHPFDRLRALSLSKRLAPPS